jgi:hypothetical protein
LITAICYNGSFATLRKAAARLSDHFRHELRRYGVRAAEPIIEFAGITMFWKVRHGSSHIRYGREWEPYPQDSQNAI